MANSHRLKLLAKLVTFSRERFTSHNTDLLDMSFPKHAYTFLKRDPYDDKTTAVDASYYLKKDAESLRNAVENDLFQAGPNLDFLTKIEDLISYEEDE